MVPKPVCGTLDRASRTTYLAVADLSGIDSERAPRPVVDLSDGVDETVWGQSSDQYRYGPTSGLAPDRGRRSGTTGLLQWVVDQLRQSQHDRRDHPCRSAELCRRQPQDRVRSPAAQQVAVRPIVWTPRRSIYEDLPGLFDDIIRRSPATPGRCLGTSRDCLPGCVALDAKDRDSAEPVSLALQAGTQRGR